MRLHFKSCLSLTQTDESNIARSVLPSKCTSQWASWVILRLRYKTLDDSEIILAWLRVAGIVIYPLKLWFCRIRNSELIRIATTTNQLIQEAHSDEKQSLAEPSPVQACDLMNPTMHSLSQRLRSQSVWSARLPMPKTVGGWIPGMLEGEQFRPQSLQSSMQVRKIN